MPAAGYDPALQGSESCVLRAPLIRFVPDWKNVVQESRRNTGRGNVGTCSCDTAGRGLDSKSSVPGTWGNTITHDVRTVRGQERRDGARRANRKSIISYRDVDGNCGLQHHAIAAPLRPRLTRIRNRYATGEQRHPGQHKYGF